MSIKNNNYLMLLGVALLVLLLVAYEFYFPAEQETKREESIVGAADYVGAGQCVECHKDQYEHWKNSHHDLSMQQASDETVLGDFDNAVFDYFGTRSLFYKENDQYFVETDGSDGQLTKYRIAYVFGVYPLQQYLIKFPGGRYQALNIVWDTRPKNEGGQRWFHLYPNEQIKHDDELHWTGINQNWNFMCADCHSTNLQKNYNHKNKEYKTTWSSIDVSCEACHGPASQHMAWSRTKNEGMKNKGFPVSFNERKNITWLIDSKSGNAKRSLMKNSNTEIEVCAQCHARRSKLETSVAVGRDFLDQFQIALLTAPLYHADGQINEEVYVYGSFLQSKMYHAGVTCSDCHEPHSLALRVEGNSLCSQCHAPSKYDNSNHHLHPITDKSPACVDCHMPSKKFMIVDARRDHSFRIPRPDLSIRMGVPNACTQCHSNKSNQWAASELKKVYGEPQGDHYAEALFAGRHGLPVSEALLSGLIADKTQPAIARATAVTLLPQYWSGRSISLFQLAADDEEPLLGLGLALALNAIPEEHRLTFAYPLLFKDKSSIRSLAAAEFSVASVQRLPAVARQNYIKGTQEYEAIQLFNADRPESLVNLAGYYMRVGKNQNAEPLYQDAILLSPYYTPAYINFADYYRAINDENSGEVLLRKALLLVRDKAPVQHALGLLLVRKKDLAEAIKFLRLAANSATTTDRYIYVYAIALNSIGKAPEAVAVLERAFKDYPASRDILMALISLNRELGKDQQAQYYEGIANSSARQ